MGIDRDLFDLLHEHDCVIVPRWGGFLAQYRPARLDKARNLIHPPAKEVGYNRHLLRNDGLLADRLAHRDGIDHGTAVSRLDAEVEQWRTALDKTGRLELPRIGIFYRDADRNLQFDPDERTNFLKDAYGLRPVVAIPVQVRKVVTMPTPVAVPVLADEPVRNRSWMWAAAASTAVIFGATMVWAFLTLGSENGQWSAGLPWAQRTAPTYVPNSEVPTLTTEASVFSLPEEPLGVQAIPLRENDALTVTVDLGSPVKEAVKDSTLVVVPANSTLRARYHVIGGCFAQLENADRLLEELQGKGFPAVRLSQRGELFPVAYGSFPDRTSALAQLDAIRNAGSGQAWLLIR